jgi:spore coat polysaccharide biosynthesis predicted glycosyltransferase SpsG
LSLASELKKRTDTKIDLLIFGEKINRNDFTNLNVTFISLLADFNESIKKFIKKFNPSIVVFDLCPRYELTNLNDLLLWIKKRNKIIISIDSLTEYCSYLDLVWIPSFYFDFKNLSSCRGKLKSGWDTYLIQKRLPQKSWKDGSRVLVLTGGSDSSSLGNTLPCQLDALIDSNLEIDWVQGPFAQPPSLPDNPRLKWTIHYAPKQLDELIVKSNYVVTVFGVSFFEVLQYGIPSVVFSPYGNKDDKELQALSIEEVALVVKNSNQSVHGLIELTSNYALAKKYSMNSSKKMSVNGAQNLSKEIFALKPVK